jgi:hypothetical protein
MAFPEGIGGLLALARDSWLLVLSAELETAQTRGRQQHVTSTDLGL